MPAQVPVAVQPAEPVAAAEPARSEDKGKSEGKGLFAIGEVVMAIWTEDGLWYR